MAQSVHRLMFLRLFKTKERITASFCCLTIMKKTRAQQLWIQLKQSLHLIVKATYQYLVQRMQGENV